MKQRNLAIVGISETRLKGKGNKLIHDNNRLIWSGSANGRHGVAIILSEDLADRISNVKSVNERILCVTLKIKTQHLNIIQVYAPQQGLSEQVKDEFFTKLEQTVDSLAHRENTIVMGDLNGHIGTNRAGYEDIIGEHSIGDRNREGERILDFCVRNRMSIMNTFYEHKPSHKWTWYRWDRVTQTYSSKSMIDLVLSNRKTLTHNIKAIPSLSFDSDHRAVFIIINIGVQKPATAPKRRRLKIEKLQEDALKNEMCVKVEEIMPTELSTLQSVEEEWNTFHTEVLNIARSTIGEKWVGGTKKKQTPYWTEEVKEAVKEKMNKFRVWMKRRTEETRQEYVQARNTAQNTIRRAKKESWNKLADDLANDCQGSKKLLYSLAKTYRKGSDEMTRSIKDADGKLLLDPLEMDHRWKEYFQCLMNVSDINEQENEATILNDLLANENDDQNNENDIITMEELDSALKDMRKNKATGADDLPAEIYKQCGDGIKRWILRLFNAAWRDGSVPEEWGKAIICPVFKKGDKLDCANYRAISLLPHISKIYERILERRLRVIVEDKLAEWQHGFRPNRSTTDLIFALKILIEKSWEWNVDQYFAFLDLEKAFDRVPRQKLWKLLQKTEYSIPPKLQQAIKGMYKTSKSAVRPQTGDYLWFDITTGVRQGSVLSPLLFVLLMDQVLKTTNILLANNRCTETMAYADDVGLAAEKQQNLQRMMDVWCKVLADFGLKLNSNKTEVMAVTKTPKLMNITANGQELKQVESFKYLGVTFDSGAQKETTINDRINKYSQNVGLLFPLLRDKRIPRKAKISIYQSILQPILLYGSECWTLTEPMKSKVQAAEMKVLRLIKGVTLFDKQRNEDIRRELGVKSVLDVIQQTQLRWYGHVMRMDNSRLPKKWLDWKPQSKRSVGRPRKRWMDNISEGIQARGTTLAEVERNQLYNDRERWRHFWTDRP